MLIFQVLLGVLLVLERCRGVSVSTDGKSKTAPKMNTIPSTPKPEYYYQQSQPNLVPVQIVQKPIYVPQPPQAMVIIAQPAYVPQHLIYGNPGMLSQQQQLLHYFHNNPQAKYQLLYGGAVPAHPQQYLAHNPSGASTIATYQVLPQPIYNNVVANPSHMALNHAVAPLQGNHMNLGPFAHIAQMATQQYRSIPPIVTGFENFTPEQQVQIKAQLSAHLGAPITTLPTAPSTQTTQATRLNSNEFAYGHEKNMPANAGISPSLLYRAQFTKG